MLLSLSHLPAVFSGRQLRHELNCLPNSMTQRSIPRAIPPCGGASLASIKEETKAFLSNLWGNSEIETFCWSTDREFESFHPASEPLITRPRQLHGTLRVRRKFFNVFRMRCSKGVMHCSPVPSFFITGEHRKIYNP